MNSNDDDAACDWHEKGVCLIIKDAIEVNTKASVFDEHDMSVVLDDVEVEVGMDENGKINGVFPSVDKNVKYDDVEYSCCHVQIADDQENGLKESHNEKIERYSDAEDGVADFALIADVMWKLERTKGLKEDDMKRCFSDDIPLWD